MRRNPWTERYVRQGWYLHHSSRAQTNIIASTSSSFFSHPVNCRNMLIQSKSMNKIEFYRSLSTTSGTLVALHTVTYRRANTYLFRFLIRIDIFISTIRTLRVCAQTNIAKGNCVCHLTPTRPTIPFYVLLPPKFL